MNIATRKTLVEFYTLHPKATAPLSAWYKHVKAANWTSPQDVKDDFKSADFLADNRVVFNIGGNNYRLVVRISYAFKQVLVKFVGTHADYDKIDAATI